MTITRRSLLAAMGSLLPASALAALPEFKTPVADPAARIQALFDQGVVRVEAKRVGTSTWERILTTPVGRRADVIFPLDSGTYEFRLVIDLPDATSAMTIQIAPPMAMNKSSILLDTHGIEGENGSVFHYEQIEVRLLG